MLALVWRIACSERDGDQALIAVVILAGSALFFVGSGAVITDTSLAFGICLVMASFWLGVVRPGKHGIWWRYGLFAAMGLGLLAKGPIALILGGAPIFLWALLHGRLWSSIRGLPWLGGLVLMLLVTVPWYWLAEQRTPGFLQYFLVGENVLRFVDSEWSGDLYGRVHTRPRGFIWLLWLACIMPWTFLLPLAALRYRRPARSSEAATSTTDQKQWRSYLLAFALTPPLFFTFAGSVLPTYVLPAMPAFALLLSEFIPHRRSCTGARWIPVIALALPLSFAIAIPVFNARYAPEKSHSALLSQLPEDKSVIYFSKRPYSGQFYAEGRAVEARTIAELLAAVTENPDAYLAVPTSVNAELPQHLIADYEIVKRAGDRHEFNLLAPTGKPQAR